MTQLSAMRRSEAFNEIAGALAKAQAKIEPAPADKTGKVKSDKAHYEYYYADLAGVREACRGPLAENGIAVLQPVAVDGAKVTVTTMLAHSSGQWFEADLTLTAPGIGAQQIGGAITYARRYGLAAMVGVAAEKDDDGEGDERARHQQQATAAKREAPKPMQAQPGSMDAADAQVDEALQAIEQARDPKALESIWTKANGLNKARSINDAQLKKITDACASRKKDITVINGTAAQ